jgi:hypothetical protein
MGANAVPSGGYNFQPINPIMDDHFEHYKRPASRAPSVDKANLQPTSLNEVANPGARPPRGRSTTRQSNSNIHAAAMAASASTAAAQSSSRAPSRNRTPLPLGASHTDMDLDLRRKELEAKFAQNGDLQAEPKEDPALRFRGQPSQEIAHLGTIPKRTESLYLKQSLESKGKVIKSTFNYFTARILE